MKVSHVTIIEREAKNSDEDGQHWVFPRCREYSPNSPQLLKTITDKSLHEKNKYASLRCEQDPKVTCIDQNDCKDHTRYSDPHHKCLIDYLNPTIPLHMLTTVLKDMIVCTSNQSTREYR